MMMLLSRSISRRDREEDGLYDANLLDRKSPRMRRSQQVSPALGPCACGDPPSKMIHRVWSPRQVDRRRRMAQALEKLAEIDAFSEISDPVEWQREIRKD